MISQIKRYTGQKSRVVKNALITIFLVLSTIASATDYYISSSGNDTNNGLSSSTPWKTIAKVNSSSFSAGDSIFFNRGDEWREQLRINQSGTVSSRITFTAYGVGAKPIINGADVITGWGDTYNNINANIWGIVDPSATAGKTLVVIDDSLYTQVVTLAELTSPRKYWINKASTPDSLYLWSKTDPNVKVTEIAHRDYGIYSYEHNYIIISYLDVRNAGSSGIYLGGTLHDGYCIVDSIYAYRNRLAGIELVGTDFSHNLVTNCVATYNGNGILGWKGTNNTSFSHCYTAHGVHNYIDPAASSDGSGLQFYLSNNVIVEYCESYDDATSIFLDPGAQGTYNMTARYNYVHESQAGRAGIGLNPVGAGASIYVYYNLIVDCGGGNYEVGSLHVAGNNLGMVYIYNNTIYNPATARNTKGALILEYGSANTVLKNNIVYYKTIGDYAMFSAANAALSTEAFISDYNIWYDASTSKTYQFWINHKGYETLTPWRSHSRQDLHSQETDPLFINNAYDWTLQSGSPAINAGIDVGLTKDFKGNPIIGLPDIGAFESQIDQ